MRPATVLLIVTCVVVVVLSRVSGACLLTVKVLLVMLLKLSSAIV